MNNKGFSLLEIVVTVAILGVLVGIAIPNYLTWNARYEFKGAAHDLASNLKLAKLSAMSRNTTITVKLQANGNDTEYVTTNAVIPTETLPSDLTVVGGLPVDITFNAFGQRTSGGTGDQIINIDSTSNASTRYVITIRISGKVSVVMTNI
ncbi:prepilin-type N-terminal cleavage/methylation domain-containing protein [Nitrospira defluvii]|nr:prepilin-type N-terminal cleavage/methylation domain-containing protein [Nitrospira defluvii]